MTKEETREYNKAYRAKNKEKKKEQDRDWRAKNKGYMKEYYIANSDKIRAKKKAYHEANKEKIANKIKAQRETYKDGLYTIYYLPKHHYIGVTTRLKYRLHQHKSNGKDTSGCVEMYKLKNQREALDVERQLHEELGFNGGQWYSKKKFRR